MTTQPEANNTDTRSGSIKPHNAGSDSLNLLCHNVLPVWSGQIDLARTHVEDAALDLVKHFVGIAGRIDQIAQTLVSAENVVANMRTESDAPENSVSALQESFRILRSEREAISQAVHQGVVALQFQDRVSQVLGHVRSDLEKLRLHIDDRGRLPDSFDVRAWLDELIRTYSMEQQREIHRGGAPATEIDVGDITLF